MAGTNTMKSSLASMITLKAPPIKRRHLRKYSWLPDVLRIKGSVISSIFGPVLTVTIFATIVVYATHNGYDMGLTNSVVPLLSVVVGLILVFRNGTSYDRYWEGRKSFAALMTQSRNLARQIWINVALPPADAQLASGNKSKAPLTAVQLRKKKVEALHLILAFVIATKHYLRGEDGLEWDDLRGHLPGWLVHRETASPASYGGTVQLSRASSLDMARSGRASPDTYTTVKPDATKRIRVKRSKPKLATSATPLLPDSYYTVDINEEGSLPLPLTIAHELTRALFLFRREGCLETVGPAGTNAMTQIVQSMVDSLGAMERVANTPIPVSYSIHLKQCVTLYLFALPMTMVHDLGWMTVPITTVVAFTLMGIEGIADEIEMPFGTDRSDLPLDRYCQDLVEEIRYTTERIPEVDEGLGVYDDGEGDD